VFLNQLVFSRSVRDAELAFRLITLYFALFKSGVERSDKGSMDSSK
jgi:hypothetical protein